jgi:hypothetical protein
MPPKKIKVVKEKDIKEKDTKVKKKNKVSFDDIPMSTTLVFD